MSKGEKWDWIEDRISELEPNVGELDGQCYVMTKKSFFKIEDIDAEELGEAVLDCLEGELGSVVSKDRLLEAINEVVNEAAERQAEEEWEIRSSGGDIDEDRYDELREARQEEKDSWGCDWG